MRNARHYNLRQPGLTILQLILFIVITGMAIGFLLPTAEPSRHPPRLLQCKEQLKKIALAVRAYAEANGRFPPPYILDDFGKPSHSWRVLILPYLGSRDLYDTYRFDEPWDSPHNLALAPAVAKLFQCPSDLAIDQASSSTNYLAVIGSDTIWADEVGIPFSEVEGRLDEVVVVVETTSVVGKEVNVLEPRDLRLDQLDGGTNRGGDLTISSNHPGGANVAFADGHVEFVMDGEDARDLKLQLMTALNGQ
ncbi:MAG: DUF1559 domain-containing protein [Planctomycetales bacterium]|nr:DUF1559 domain-containing protein [Planctomycetales bacterium]